MSDDPVTAKNLRAEIKQLKKHAMDCLFNEHLLKTLLQYSTDYIYFKDLQSRFICISNSLSREVYKCENPEDTIGKTDFDFYDEKNARKAFKDEQKIIKTGKKIVYDFEEMKNLPEERTRWSSTIKMPLYDKNGVIIGTFGVSRNVTDLKLALVAQAESEQKTRAISKKLSVLNKELSKANEELSNSNFTDSLTGLKNRRFLSARLSEDVAQVKRVQNTLSSATNEHCPSCVTITFLMVDIDHFKHVNDTYGHQAGDMVLQQIAKILSTVVRGSDTVARWGGEEFLVIARDTSNEDPMALPERIRNAIEKHLFKLGARKSIHLTCSIGFCCLPLGSHFIDVFTGEQIIELADQCLFVAKRNGRNAWIGVAENAKILDETKKAILPNIPAMGLKNSGLPIITSIKTPLCWID